MPQSSWASALLDEELLENFLRKVGIGEDLGHIVEFFEFIEEAKGLECLRLFESYGAVGNHGQLRVFDTNIAQ